MSGVFVRPAGQADLEVLERMLCWAGSWRSDELNESVLADPTVRRYLDAWGRPGDFAVVAETQAGEPVGASWYRLFSAEDESYGFVDEKTLRSRSESTPAIAEQASDERC